MGAIWLSSTTFLEGGIYWHANFYCYANFSIVFRPNFKGEKSGGGGELLYGALPSLVVESQLLMSHDNSSHTS